MDDRVTFVPVILERERQIAAQKDEARRANDADRPCPMEAKAQATVEASQMIHVGMAWAFAGS